MKIKKLRVHFCIAPPIFIKLEEDQKHKINISITKRVILSLGCI